MKTKFTPCIGCSGSMVNLSRSVLMGKNPKIPTLKPPLKLHSCARKVIVFKRKGDCYWEVAHTQGIIWHNYLQTAYPFTNPLLDQAMCDRITGFLKKKSHDMSLHSQYHFHVWYVYLHLVVFLKVNVGKYTVRPMDGTWDLFCFPLLPR